MRNDKFLEKVLKGEQIDYLYHIGLTSESPELSKMKNIKAVVMAGSRKRIRRMAQQYNGMRFVFEKKERFYAEYVEDVLFISHGMGMPSMSICLQEVLKLLYYLKDGNMTEVNKVFLCRVGTSGGIGLPEGSIVITENSFLADLTSYRIKRYKNMNLSFSGEYPQNVIKDILKANPDKKIVVGNTISADDFYLEQLREDGAIVLLDKDEKEKVLNIFDQHKIKNIEMEAAMIPALCLSFGHKNFATVCATLVDRLAGDQVKSTPEELKEYSLRAEAVIFDYLKTL